MKFPSTQWFEALQEQATKKTDQFKKLGFADAIVGILVAPENGGSGSVLSWSSEVMDASESPRRTIRRSWLISL